MPVVTFPLSVAGFFATLPVKSIRFDAPVQVEASQTGRGEFYTAEIGQQLWVGRVSLGQMTTLETSNIQTLLNLLEPPGRSFYAYDTRRPAPLSDPLGTILGASVPTIQSLPSGNREMALQALPAGYVLTRGDYIAFDYGGVRALHRVVAATAVASGVGVTPVFEVLPFLQPGVTVGTAVTLIKAACKAVMIPGSVDYGTTFHGHTEGSAFDFQQTLG